MTYEQAAALALAFPGVTAATSYGTPCVRTKKRMILRQKEKMDGVVALMLASVDEQEHLIERDPQTFFITDHYRGYPMVLARLATIDAAMLAGFIEAEWRRASPARVIRAYDARA